MPKKCYNCGMMKKITFNCSECGKRVCLNCFNFLINKCMNCEVEDFNEKYKEKIRKYEENEMLIGY